MKNQATISRKKQSIEVLIDSSKHLFYEFRMFNSLAQEMILVTFEKGYLNNAILESFTLHARALLDFLYTEKPKVDKDDVIAEDYFDTPLDWITIRPNKTDLLKCIHKRVGKEIAHLTYTRLYVTPEEKPWQFAKIANEINTVFRILLTNINKEMLDPSWEELDLHNHDDSGNI